MSRSGSPYGHHVHSLYVPQDRPIIPRLRSNSLPPGLALMNAQEAGMLFSAAEQATARRKKTISVDHSYFPDSPPDSLDNSPLPTVNASAFKPSPLRTITSIRASMDKPLPPAPLDHGLQSLERPQSLKKSPPSSLDLPDSLIQILPMSPLSPNKRQVSSHSLKSYADGLFKFTHNILATSVPELQIDSPEVSPHTPRTPEPQEQAPVYFSQHLRPPLESKFSDWSIATGENIESRRNSLAYSPVELDLAMMSPDSFFGDDSTPRRRDFEVKRFSGMSFASSETYEPRSTLPQSTPPSRTSVVKDEEISYFTNYDRFLEQDSSHQNWPLPNAFPPENVVIDLSPMEMIVSPQTPAPSSRVQRADMAIRHMIRSAPLLTANASPCTLYSSPSTPLHQAEVAVRVPNWLIGAIG